MWHFIINKAQRDNYMYLKHLSEDEYSTVHSSMKIETAKT